MAAEKLSVILQDEDLTWVQDKARENECSISAVLAEAVHRVRKQEAMARYLKRHGEADITAEDVAEVLNEVRHR